MIQGFYQDKFVGSLLQAAASVDEAARYGEQIAHEIDRIYFVSCGAPNRVMLGLQYWIEKFSPTLEVRRYFPAEFMDMQPPRLDSRTLVVLASKSGTTTETVAAARFLQNLPCKTLAVTQTAELPLAQSVQKVFLTGKTDEAYFGCFMLLQAVIGGILASRDQWPYRAQLLSSLKALPLALAEAVIGNDARAAAEARLYKDDRILYHLASGPMFTAAYVLGTCILAESQWMHSHALEAAEFFHGPFEIVDHTTPLILFLGEDPSRPQMERVVRFCQRYTERTMIYDAKDFVMTGIAPEIRPIVAPYIVGIAAERIAAHLAVWHEQPLTTRRYMWKTEY
ncbi:SIS domain-containing protein [Leeia oryzae]|uniref:SIS domain-containing protein n=1 Tax=Leeia oryzae TaxID=356662 RepID=UPI0003777074|nr:SIS domain-containing protein [Leeia oryzae]